MLELDALERAVALALRDGKPPWAALPHRSDRVIGMVIKRLHAKGAVRYERHSEFVTPIVTAAGKKALASVGKNS